MEISSYFRSQHTTVAISRQSVCDQTQACSTIS